MSKKLYAIGYVTKIVKNLRILTFHKTRIYSYKEYSINRIKTMLVFI